MDAAPRVTAQCATGSRWSCCRPQSSILAMAELSPWFCCRPAPPATLPAAQPPLAGRARPSQRRYRARPDASARGLGRAPVLHPSRWRRHDVAPSRYGRRRLHFCLCFHSSLYLPKTPLSFRSAGGVSLFRPASSPGGDRHLVGRPEIRGHQTRRIGIGRHDPCDAMRRERSRIGRRQSIRGSVMAGLVPAIHVVPPACRPGAYPLGSRQ
jgi:hypothetical protein